LAEADARESAQLRVEANNVLDTITGKTSTDIERDWQRCKSLLEACYLSIQRHAEGEQVIPATAAS
jgi:hypothetical protein